MRKIILIICLICSSTAYANNQIVEAAKKQIGLTLFYDPAYTRIPYPNGDVALQTGVCADVIIRAIRAKGIDLQKEVHQDMVDNFELYPNNWGLQRPDTNIDHRRVPNLAKYFARHHLSLPPNKDFAPGDIVTWNLSSKGFIPHVGIVSDTSSEDNVPLIIHNIGNGVQEEDILFDYIITGHYRLRD